MGLAAADAVGSPSREGAARDFWLPWTFRRILALPGPPLAIGAAAVALSLVIDAVWFNASGLWQGLEIEGTPVWLHPYASINFAYAVCLGLGVVSLFYLVRGAERDISQLGPALELAPGALAELRCEILSVPPRSLRIGTAIALVTAAFDLGVGFGFADMGRFNSWTIAWLALREVLWDLLIFRVFTWATIVALRLSRLGRASARIRLFDLATLRPFTRNGVRLALFWLSLWAIWVPVLFLGPFGGDALPALAIMLAIGSLLSIVAVTLPTVGVRSRVREAKAAELAEVRSAIESDRSAALDPDHPGRDAAAARLPGLLAYEDRVSGISESLLDAGSVRRLALYLLIPLASWVGGAMIERQVDAILD